MRYFLTTILSLLLLLTSPLFGQETGVLYQYETSSGIKWKTFGDGKVQPKYEGEIKNGKMDGLGVLIFPYNGENIVGEWKNGKEWNTKHNKKDGTLIGKWVNGEWIKSRGVLFERKVNGVLGWYKDGNEKNDRKYVGEIVDGVPDGQGTLTYPDERKYVGEFKDGKRDGQGTLTFPDGDKYVGEFKDGLYDGQGTYTNSNGDKYVGEFKDGQPWNLTKYDKNGNIKEKWVNGLLQI